MSETSARSITLPALNPETVPTNSGSSYPEPFGRNAEGRHKQALGDALSIRNFGINLVRLDPGAWSAVRHWHSAQDEFIYVIDGELVLATDTGEQTLGPGMVAGFPGGKADGHHLINRTDRIATYLEVGDRMPGDDVTYPDVDLLAPHRLAGVMFTHKNGEPY